MSNISLGGNNGTSINFDAAALQSQQEDEYRKEEEQQQNELRALLTNAFDDLIDDDDILSILSDDGTDSRNVSLVRRHSSDSLGPPHRDDKNSESPEPKPNTNWTKFINNAGPQSRQLNPRQIPQSRFGPFEPLSRTQELPRGQLDLLRASVESLPNFPSNQNGSSIDSRSRDSVSVRGSHDLLDSDYHSTADEQQKADFHGNVYTMNSMQGQHSAGQGHIEGQQNHHQNNILERDNVLRKSIEDFSQFKEAYQGQENFYGPHGNLDHLQAHQQHYHAAEQPYDQGQGHYYHHHHHHDPQVHSHGYEGHYPDAHHHFRNIYQDRPYHTIGEREETEGGNVVQQLEEMQYLRHGYGAGHLGHGYQGDEMRHHGPESGNVNNNNYGHEYIPERVAQDGFHAQSGDHGDHVRTSQNTVVVNGQTGSGNGRKLPQVTYRLQNVSKEAKDKQRTQPNMKVRDKESVSKNEKSDSFKARYEKEQERKRDEVPHKEKEEHAENIEKDFMDQGGSGENQQLAQLQILYKARGRKIEELTNEIEVVKSESGREMRILKHQLSVARGEKEGSSKSLDSVQSLLLEAKNDNAQLVGRVHACESQVEGLKKAKEELINKLQTAESTIETLHQHLEELGSSDTLTRAKHDHEVVVDSLQKKYETEIKHLQENNGKLITTIQEKTEEIATLKMKLGDSIKNSESSQISRAETINRLTQSLEESQKRCRNLLEASSSQEMSQMKIHLQQALASKSISDEMCSSFQEEIQDLKEQVQMLESASNLGISTVTAQSSNSNFVDQNDSMADLGIKKTLDFDTPQGTPTVVRNQSVMSNEVVTSLKAELERCLVSNKQKRTEVTELKEEMRKVKKGMLEYRQRCEKADLLTQEQKKRIVDLESCMSPGEKSNAVENRLRKDVENLKREKKVLLEDIEELQQRLDEVSRSEERLTELNRELSKQISDMVKEYDEDKREAVERAHRASEQVAETSRNKLRQELTLLFDAERSEILAKYEKECCSLREELKIAQDEIDRVKEEYVKLCEEKENVKYNLNTEWSNKMDVALAEVKGSMMKEAELSMEKVRESLLSDKEEEISKLKENLYKEFSEEKEKLKETIQHECEDEQKLRVERLQSEHFVNLKAERNRFENELKTLRDMSEMEKNNDLEKLDKEKVNEIEKLKNVIIDKELFISEKEQIFREKEHLLSEKMQILNTLKAEYKSNMDNFQAEMKENVDRIEELEKECEEKAQEICDKNCKMEALDAKYVALETLSNEKSKELEILKRELNDKSNSLVKESNEKIDSVEIQKKEVLKKVTALEEESSNKTEAIDELQKELSDKAKQLEQLLSSLEEKDNIVEQLKEDIKTLKKEVDDLEKSKTDIEMELDLVKKQCVEKESEVTSLRAGTNSDSVLKEKVDEMNKLKREIEKLESDKGTEIDKWRKEETERQEVEHLRKEIDKNIKKDRQSEVEGLRREVIRLKLEIDRMDTNTQKEVDKVCRIKQAEIDNIEKRKKLELERLRKEKQAEIDRIMREKDEEIARLKRSPSKKTADAGDSTEKLRDKLNRDLEEDMKKTLETKVAMSKVMWLEEHRATRQAAIDNAVRLAETEMRLKMEDDIESKLEARLEEAKILWQSDSMSQLDEERKNWDTLKEEEINARLDTEKETWRQTELETERQKWAKELEQRLEEEKESWREFELETEKLKWASDCEIKLVQEKESWIKNMLEPAKRKWRMESEENLRREKENWRCTELETEKLNLMREYEQRLAHEKQTLTSEAVPAALEREKNKWKQEMEDRLSKEKEEWRKTELAHEMDKEKEKWFVEVEGRMREERNNWKNCDLPEEIERERRKWMKLMEQTLIKEKENWKNRDLPVEVKKVREDLEQKVESEVETRLVQKLETEKEKMQQVNLAVQDARDDWNREYMMEMSISTTSAEASQGLLKEEIERLKHELEQLRTEYMEKEETWMKDREDLMLQKDLERRRVMDSLQEQTETEYKQFLDEHKDMLDKALKAAREQHNVDMSELEERYKTQLKILQAREKSLQEQLQDMTQSLQKHQELLSELEKDKVVWYDERENLVQEISDRDSLLGKADVHLSKEVDKLRSELQAAYQRRLETEMNSWRQKMETEFARANNSEQKEKLQLEKQLSEVSTELNKLRNQLKEEKGKHAEEVKTITNKMNVLEKRLHDHDRLEGELKKAKELLKGYKDELTDNQTKCEKLKNENEDLFTKLNKSIQNQTIVQAELQKLKDDKSTNIESVQSIESAYRKDISLYKQKLEESNTRIVKTEKVLLDMKHKYRSELESLRKALEVENDVAMNAMKNKMIELQKKHVAIVDEMKRKHQSDREELLKHGHSAALRGITPTANMGEVEDIDRTVKELRSQYLDTVAKIKDDVLRHITQTNVRAAETVKLEMDKERMTTFQQIKDFYRQNVKQILDTEMIGASLESKLLAVEEALENLSSNPSSRSATPSDEYFLDERQMKSRSRSASRDAGISPKGQRSVSFTSGTKGERSRTPVNSGKDLSMSGQFEDPRSPKSRLFTKSPRDIHVTVRGDTRNNDVPDLRSELRNSKDWKYDALKDSSYDTRNPDNRPTSARLAREIRENETLSGETRPLSAKSPKELHISLRQRNTDTDYVEDSTRERNRSGDKKKSRMLISTRDIHSGRYNRGPDGSDVTSGHNGDMSGYYGEQRAKSVTPMYSSMSRSSPSLYRPTSVPDLSGEDKELKIWTETNNDTYRYTPLRDTLKLGTNLHRNNSKSESDLSIAERNFGPMKPEYDSNLDLSTGSLTSDMFLTPRKRDAGETPTPTSTPRRHTHRKHYTLHSFPTRDQITSELRSRDPTTNDSNNDSLNMSRNDDAGVNSPVSRTSRKNLPLIQFRHGKVQSLAKGPGTSSKSPHPEEGVIVRDTPPTRDTTGTPERHYRPLSVSSNTHLNF